MLLYNKQPTKSRQQEIKYDTKLIEYGILWIDLSKDQFDNLNNQQKKTCNFKIQQIKCILNIIHIIYQYVEILLQV